MRRILIICLLLFASIAGAATLQWNASVVDDTHGAPTGYRIHRGTAPGVYDWQIDVGNVLQWPIPDDLYGSYYWASSAYNGAGSSGYSNEVYWQRAPPQYAGATNLRASKLQGEKMGFTYVNSATAVDSTTCNKPSGTAQGDLLTALILSVDDEAMTISGWTEDYSKNDSSYGDNVLTFKVFSKIAGANEPASYSITGYTGYFIAWGIVAHTPAGTPSFDTGAASMAESTTNSATIVANTLTTSLSNGLIFYFGLKSAVSCSWTSPSGVTERAEIDTGFFSTEIQAAAGASTARTFTCSVSDTEWRGVITVAYKDVVGGASAVPVFMRLYRARRN